MYYPTTAVLGKNSMYYSPAAAIICKDFVYNYKPAAAAGERLQVHCLEAAFLGRLQLQLLYLSLAVLGKEYTQKLLSWLRTECSTTRKTIFKFVLNLKIV